MDISKQTNKTIKMQKIAPEDAANIVDVQRIFQGRRKIALKHQENKYILQITSNNKLLLTK